MEATDDGADECDDPCELCDCQHGYLDLARVARGRLTMLMEMVDRAKGSPRMLSKLKRVRAP